MCKNRLLTIVLGFVFSIQIFGYAATTGSIVGSVKDKKSGEAIIGATIQVENSSVATATDIDG